MDVPTGVVLTFAGGVLPDGYDWCHGQQVNSTDAKYRTLFGVIGTAHGGDGATNFNLPDYRGMFLRGVDGGRGVDPDKGSRTTPQSTSGNSGNKLGSIQSAALAAHTHTYTGRFLEAAGGGGFSGHGFDSNSRQSNQVFQIDAAGGAETRPVNAYVEYIIKL